jgi:hypothetical protein
MPGVAAPDAPDGEPGAAAGAVEGERFERVLGARRVEATPRRQVHADEAPGPDRQHEKPREGSGSRDLGRGRRRHAASSRTAARSAVTCSHSVGKGTVITGRSAANRYAPPGTSSPASSATAARSRRRARLRSTAVPNRRPMAYATRGGSSEPSLTKRNETGPARRRRALARASNVARSRTRQIRPRDASARGRGGRAARRDPPWCACGGGNRGSWHACDCWVGTCASTKSLLEAVARGPKSGTTREAETAKCTAGIAPFATRRAVWGKPPGALVAQGCRCYVARLVRRRPAVRTSPVCQCETRPTFLSISTTISTPVDALVDNFRQRRTRPDRGTR